MSIATWRSVHFRFIFREIIPSMQLKFTVYYLKKCNKESRSSEFYYNKFYIIIFYNYTFSQFCSREIIIFQGLIVLYNYFYNYTFSQFFFREVIISQFFSREVIISLLGINYLKKVTIGYCCKFIIFYLIAEIADSKRDKI